MVEGIRKDKEVFDLGLFFWCVACGILVPQPEIEPTPPAVEAQSLTHWTTRKVPKDFYL